MYVCSANPCSLAWTTPRKVEIAYKWIINEAEVLLMNAKKAAQSPPFEVSKVSPFPLYLYINYDSANNRLCMYFGHDNLNYSEKKPSVWLSKCYASIFDPQSQNVKHGICFSEKEIVSSNGVYKASEYFNNLKPLDLRKLFQEGALVIHFCATLTSLSDFDMSTGGKGPSATEYNLGHTMRSMLGDEVFSDAVIKVGGKTYKVHRAVLASQSDVFRRMFEADMKEKKEGVVEVFDVDSEVMSDLLTYVYTGSAPNIKTMAKDLLFAADKYNLTGLASCCEKELQTTFTINNVIDILLVADNLPLRVVLRDACMNYIKHNSKAIFQSNSWKVLKEASMPLAIEVSEKAFIN